MMAASSALSRSFFDNALVMMGGTALAQAIPILFAPVLTRIYSPEQYGVLATFIGVAAVMTVVATLRLEPAVVLPENDAVAANIAAVALLVATVVSALVLVVALAGKEFIARQWPAVGNGAWLLLVGPMVLLLALTQTASFWANRTRRFSVIAGGTVLQQGGTALLSLFAGLSGGAQLGLVAGRFGGQCLSAVWLVSRVFSEWRHVFGKVSWSGMKAAVSSYRQFPKFNLPYSLVGTVSRELLVFALTLFHFTQQAGFYGLARSVLYSPVSFLSSSLSQVFYKEAADSIGTPAFEALVARLLGGIILVFTPAFVALVFWGPELFAFAFGAEWREAGVYAAIFAPAAWLFLFSSWPERIFEVAGRQQLSLAIQLVSDILSVTVVLALLWQEASPRVVLAAYTAIACGYHCAFVTAAFNVARLPASILWGAIARRAVMIVAAASAFAACRQVGPRQGLVVAIVLTALYSGAALAWITWRRRTRIRSGRQEHVQ